MTTRRLFLACSLAAALAGCAAPPPQADSSSFEPIVFVHGNGDTEALWQTTIWRFESNGWPRDRLFAFDVKYPLARDKDDVAQPGRTSAAEHMAALKAEVDQVLRATGARQVILMGNSRGGNAIRNYIQNGGGAATVSHAILGGTPNHGVQAVKGLNDANEFSGTGPFLMGLNAPKDAAGDEVTGPVKWLTIRSDNNDKFAQPDGRWLGMPGKPTNVTYTGPELKGATNIVIPHIDHRETAYSPAAFEVAYEFITGQPPMTRSVTPEMAPMLSGKVTGLGLTPTDPASGNYVDNLPLPGAHVEIYAVDPRTGERRGGPVYTTTVGADGHWGPFAAQPNAPYEFVVAAPGYATTHTYRSPFPRSSTIVDLQAQRIAPADKDAAAVVTLVRPRGYLDPARDRMSLDGKSPPPGVLPGAGIASSKLKTSAQPRPIVAEFNGEQVVGRPWPTANNELTFLELTW
jgi:triacylglycerol lipase